MQVSGSHAGGRGGDGGGLCGHEPHAALVQTTAASAAGQLCSGRLEVQLRHRQCRHTRAYVTASARPEQSATAAMVQPAAARPVKQLSAVLLACICVVGAALLCQSALVQALQLLACRQSALLISLSQAGLPLTWQGMAHLTGACHQDATDCFACQSIGSGRHLVCVPLASTR